MTFSVNTFFTIEVLKGDVVRIMQQKVYHGRDLMANRPNLSNFPEVKIDGYDVSDIRYSYTWRSCRCPAHVPEQVVG